jgi:thymidylate synthase
MVTIEAKTINEAWFLANHACMKDGYDYQIGKGSFKGSMRRQLSALAVQVNAPHVRPLASEFKGRMFSTDEGIEQYFATYLLSSETQPHETYTYGSRITPSIMPVIEMLRQVKTTNHAIIEIGKNDDLWLNDPPCLRVLAWKVVENKLNLTSYWRSWDLAFGFPMNMGGLQLLNEWVAEEVGLPTGALVAFSDGAHIYNYCWDIFQ